jgi:hypothetical protein
MPKETQNQLANEIDQFINELEEAGEDTYPVERQETLSYDLESSSSELSGGFGDPIDESEVRDDALGVGQAEFGYLDDELKEMLGYEALEKGGVGPCYAVAVLDNENGDMALVHADKEKLKQVRQGINRASREVDGDFDAAKLVTNASKDEEFERVHNYLMQKFDEVEVDAGDGLGNRSLGVDEDGFYEPDNPAIPEQDELEGMEIMARQGVNDRTDEAIEEWYQEQWDEYEDIHLPEPISEKWVMKEGGGKKYSRRVHKPNHDKSEARYTVRFRVGDAEVEDLETEFDYDVREKGDRRVIEIKSRHPIEKDREAVEAVNQEAAQVYEKIVE